MPKIRIWNDNTLPYEEKFGDEMIKILPGKYRDMEADEAIRFLGTYKAPEVDGMGQQKRESYKMLRKEIIEPLFDDGTGNTARPTLGEFKCIVCGKECVDQEHLDGHMNGSHINEMADKNEQKKRMEQVNKARR